MQGVILDALHQDGAHGGIVRIQQVRGMFPHRLAPAGDDARDEPFIQVTNLGDFSVDFLVRVWCEASEYFAYQADIKRKVKEALDAGGIGIPFPTRTVYQTAAE